MLAAKMYCVAAPEEFQFKLRNSDDIGLKFSQCLSQSHEVGRVRKNGEVRVAAKLGCAVKYARLSAHEQGANAVCAHRRKDFEYRVQDQASLPVRHRFARVFRSPASVEQA